ncbi:FAD-dependent oxidoreductase [Streptomyces phaeoluteigriseus]|uniref:FAD-dependent oxidoreductase n=1 Tax=Streptomyces phaeoluteigriseus TaxID=114686 RepID=UPI00369B1577
MADETIGVVGAGIVGLATAREIALSRPGTRVVVLEKKRGVSLHRTGHNSGVVHAGIYYTPGSERHPAARGRRGYRGRHADHRPGQGGHAAAAGRRQGLRHVPRVRAADQRARRRADLRVLPLGRPGRTQAPAERPAHRRRPGRLRRRGGLHRGRRLHPGHAQGPARRGGRGGRVLPGRAQRRGGRRSRREGHSGGAEGVARPE